MYNAPDWLFQVDGSHKWLFQVDGSHVIFVLNCD